MKNTKELVITNKESYLKPNEAVEIAYYLFTEHNAPATIKMAGKNKCVVTLDEPEMEENRYIKIKKDIQSIKAEIYTDLFFQKMSICRLYCTPTSLLRRKSTPEPMRRKNRPL